MIDVYGEQLQQSKGQGVNQLARKGDSCDALQLEAARRRASRSGQWRHKVGVIRCGN